MRLYLRTRDIDQHSSVMIQSLLSGKWNSTRKCFVTIKWDDHSSVTLGSSATMIKVKLEMHFFNLSFCPIDRTDYLVEEVFPFIYYFSINTNRNKRNISSAISLIIRISFCDEIIFVHVDRHFVRFWYQFRAICDTMTQTITIRTTGLV